MMDAPDRMSVSLFMVAEGRLFREGLAEALAGRERLRVVGTASHEEALPALTARHPDIVLIDVVQPSAVTVFRFLRETLPKLRTIALAVPEREPEVVRWTEEGAAGCLPRDASLCQLEACIESVARGEALFTPRMTAALARRVAALAADRRPEPPRARLTGRELEIAALLREGMTNKEIARALLIETSTVKNHVHNILEKLDVRRRGEAAVRLGPLPVPPTFDGARNGNGAAARRPGI